MKSVAALDAMLTRTGAAGTFREAEIEHLPDAVQRYFRVAVSPGTPLAVAARLRMRGKIKLGPWFPFHAREVLAPRDGFVWSARVGGVIVGSDQYAGGTGGMAWKIAGLVPLMRADSEDVVRSAAERAGAEAMWVPTALLPRFGVVWTATDETHITARFDVGVHPVAVNSRSTPTVGCGHSSSNAGAIPTTPERPRSIPSGSRSARTQPSAA